MVDTDKMVLSLSQMAVPGYVTFFGTYKDLEDVTNPLEMTMYLSAEQPVTFMFGGGKNISLELKESKELVQKYGEMWTTDKDEFKKVLGSYLHKALVQKEKDNAQTY